MEGEKTIFWGRYLGLYIGSSFVLNIYYFYKADAFPIVRTAKEFYCICEEFDMDD